MKAIHIVALKTFFIVALLLGSTVHAQNARYVSFVQAGTVKAGHMWMTTTDGITHVDYLFKDNGRGPEVKEEWKVDSDGTLTSYRATGNATMGSVVDETFSRTGDKAEWKSTADKGSVFVHGGMYVPLNESPASFFLALTALAQRSDGKLPLIPTGTLTWQKLSTAEIKSSAHAKTRKVQLVAATGIGFTPTLVWMTTDAVPQLCALIYPGSFQLIEEGWEKNAAALEAQQKVAAQKLLVALEQRMKHPLSGTTLVRNARIFDSEHATLGAASDLLLQEGRIIAISKAGDEKRSADHVIDAGGRVLLPGLFDMHGHIDEWQGGLHLAAGVTTVRDMGNDNATLQEMMRKEQAGTLLSPHVVPAGFIEGQSQYASHGGFVIKDLAEAKHAIDWYAAHGYPQIKIYNSFPKAILPETTAYAHSKGMRVSGHVPVFLRAHEVVEQGYDEIQHINQVLLNFLVTDTTDTRTLERFRLPAEKVATLDFDSKPVHDFIAELVEHKTVIDPTLTTFDFVRHRAGQVAPAYGMVADHLPPDVSRSLYVAEMKIPDDATAQRYEQSYAKMVKFVGIMYRAGIPIVAGTDALPGFTLQRELELYVQAGMTPSQALQVATWNGAKYARVADDRGVIMQGKRADLVFVDGNPTQNISDIRKIALVVKGTEAYYPSEIYEALGVKPFTPPLQIH